MALRIVTRRGISKEVSPQALIHYTVCLQLDFIITKFKELKIQINLLLFYHLAILQMHRNNFLKQQQRM